MSLQRTTAFQIQIFKMKTTLSIYFAIASLLLLSCEKNQLGGNSEIKGTVMHHSKTIAYASVFIKFNATEFPGTDTLKYDSKVKADENGQFSFKLFKGNYFLYGYGYDYAIPAPYTVKGGTSVKLRSNETTNITLAVTED